MRGAGAGVGQRGQGAAGAGGVQEQGRRNSEGVMQFRLFVPAGGLWLAGPARVETAAELIRACWCTGCLVIVGVLPVV